MGLSGSDIVLNQSEGRSNALDVGKGLHVFLLFFVANRHACIEAGEALDDLRPCQEGDALGVIVHDVFRQIGSTLFAQPQLIECALLAGRLVLLVDQSHPIFHSQK